MIAGVVGALACFAAFRLFGLEPSTAVIGGVAGGVAGAAARRRTKDKAAQQADAVDRPSAGR